MSDEGEVARSVLEGVQGRFSDEWDHLTEQEQDEVWSQLIADARRLADEERRGVIERCVETILAKVILAIDAQQRQHAATTSDEPSFGRCPSCHTSGLVHDPECEWGLASSP